MQFQFPNHLLNMYVAPVGDPPPLSPLHLRKTFGQVSWRCLANMCSDTLVNMSCPPIWSHSLLDRARYYRKLISIDEIFNPLLRFPNNPFNTFDNFKKRNEVLSSWSCPITKLVPKEITSPGEVRLVSPSSPTYLAGPPGVPWPWCCCSNSFLNNFPLHAHATLHSPHPSTPLTQHTALSARQILAICGAPLFYLTLQLFCLLQQSKYDPRQFSAEELI